MIFGKETGTKNWNQKEKNSTQPMAPVVAADFAGLQKQLPNTGPLAGNIFFWFCFFLSILLLLLLVFLLLLLLLLLL